MLEAIDDSVPDLELWQMIGRKSKKASYVRFYDLSLRYTE